MKTKTTLFDFEKVATLLQYMYLDEKNKIVIHNAINVPFELYMVEYEDESVHIMCRNLNFPDLEPRLYDDECSPNTLINIVYCLQNEPAVEFPERFSNRWEEIAMISEANVSLNKFT